MSEDEVLAFVKATLPSIWTLEILLLMRATPQRAWSNEDLIHEARSSSSAVQDVLTVLSTAGFVNAKDNRWRYSPSNPELESAATEIEKLYAVKPKAVLRAILEGPNHKLRTFSDAFKLKG